MASYFNLGKCTYFLQDVSGSPNLLYRVVYAISFLCTLNTRKVIRGRGTDADSSGKNTDGARNTFFMVSGRNNTRDATATKVRLVYPYRS